MNFRLDKRAVLTARFPKEYLASDQNAGLCLESLSAHQSKPLDRHFCCALMSHQRLNRIEIRNLPTKLTTNTATQIATPSVQPASSRCSFTAAPITVETYKALLLESVLLLDSTAVSNMTALDLHIARLLTSIALNDLRLQACLSDEDM